MRIGINGAAFNRLPSGALRRFVGLYEEAFKGTAHDYVVFESRDTPLSPYFAPRPHVRFVRTVLPSDRTLQRVLLGKIYWPIALRHAAIRVFDTSGLSWIPHRGGATIHTLHDIRYVTHPSLYSLKHRLMGARETRATLRRADVVITVSESMKRQLLQFEPHATVAVLPNAIDWDEKADDVRMLHTPYVLAVGHLERRKNYVRLLSAFELLVRRGYMGHLCIVGNALDDTARVRARIAASPVKERIHLHSDVPWADLKRYYHGADLFVFPSLYEGFGIPILEAMNFGCAFVLSDLPVFREITGGKAVYFQPEDVNDIAEKMALVLSDATQRDSCRAIAREARATYSWKVVAQTYLHLLTQFTP